MAKVDHKSPAYIRAQQEWLRSDPEGDIFVGSGVKHGLRRTPTYETWANLLRRHNRGQCVLCDEWRADFRTFLADMGEKSQGYVLRRIEGETEYGPASCIWRPLTERQIGVDAYHFDPLQPHAPDEAFVRWHKRHTHAQATK